MISSIIRGAKTVCPLGGSLYRIRRVVIRTMPISRLAKVTWEKPKESPIPATHAVASQQQAAAQQTTQPVASTAADPASTPSRLASKYGDGFVSSASHPELASQYGNVGTRYVLVN